MLQSHLETIEKVLVARAKIQEQAGHAIHKGAPREAFIREFLSSHLSESVAIGTGEIIDIDSKVGERRPQIDIVIYRRDFPKLDLGGGIYAFLAESVVATIEVKSVLTRGTKKSSQKSFGSDNGMQQILNNAVRIKSLSRNIRATSPIILTGQGGYPGILNCVVAYQCPVKMTTVANWIREYHHSNGISQPIMNDKPYMYGLSPSIDGVFVLGKGFLYLPPIAHGIDPSDIHWQASVNNTSALLPLFILLTHAVSAPQYEWFDHQAYSRQFTTEQEFIPRDIENDADKD